MDSQAFTTLIGGKGLPPYFYQVNEGANYHKAFFIFPHKTMNRRKSVKKTCYHRALTILSALCTVMILTWVLGYSHYGMDFTDEGFYLNWLKNPFLYETSLSQFGFVYHPLYLIFDGDIAKLRRFNIITVYLLAWGLSWLLMNRIFAPDDNDQHVTTIVAASGFACASLIYFGFLWLLTPSYNSLNLKALLITCIGLLLSDAAHSKRSIAGWTIIGAGGWIAFMAKPTTAGLLAICVVLYLVLARLFSLRMLLISVGVTLALLVSGALLIDGSISDFLVRLLHAYQDAVSLGYRHSLQEIIRTDSFQFTQQEQYIIITVIIFTSTAAYFLTSARFIARVYVLIVSLFFLLVIILLVIGALSPLADIGRFKAMMIWGCVIAMMVFGLFHLKTISVSAIPLPQRLIALLFFFMPYIFAFGTGDNYWLIGSSAAIFWLLGGVVLLGPIAAQITSGWTFALPFSLAAQLISAVVLQSAMEQPHRHPSLFLNNRTAERSTAYSGIVMNTGYAEYIDDAVSAAATAGFTPGTPVMDMTGQSPGIIYALQAQSIGSAWLIGGYPGSLKLAVSQLRRVPCDILSKTWILDEPEGSRRIPNEALASYGANLATHYKKVASWYTAIGAGGKNVRRLQLLYMPVRQNDVLNKCNTIHKPDFLN